MGLTVLADDDDDLRAIVVGKLPGRRDAKPMTPRLIDEAKFQSRRLFGANTVPKRLFRVVRFEFEVVVRLDGEKF